MIRDRAQIIIQASPAKVFETIESMPFKFPTFKWFQAKPFLFFRIAFVDGFRSALNIVSDKNYRKFVTEMKSELKVGDSMGPFKLTEVEKPVTYMFTIRSFFFRCKTGYILSAFGNWTMLKFDIVAENPTFQEKMWWLFVKPIHRILAREVLTTIRDIVETRDSS